MRYSELGGGAPGGGDLLAGGAGELVRRDGHRNADLAGAEDLDRRTAADGAARHQRLDGDVATLGEQLADRRHVDDLVVDLERVLEAAQLGQPHVQRRLATLEARRDLVARAGALGAAAGALALAALTAADPRLCGLRARS